MGGTEQECPKCDGAGKRAVHGGMFGFQECTRCNGTGTVETGTERGSDE
jgi:DnaJ-class molecular chaperone